MATVCSRQKSSLHVSHPLPETTPWPGSWTFSQLLFHISCVALPNISWSPATKKKKKETIVVVPATINAMYGHWPEPSTTKVNAAHTDTRRSAEVTCRVFSRSSVPESERQLGLFLQSQACVTRLGERSQGPFHSFLLPSLPSHSLKSDTARITYGSKTLSQNTRFCQVLGLFYPNKIPNWWVHCP